MMSKVWIELTKGNHHTEFYDTALKDKQGNYYVKLMKV